jgi:TonB family protein
VLEAAAPKVAGKPRRAVLQVAGFTTATSATPAPTAPSAERVLASGGFADAAVPAAPARAARGSAATVQGSGFDETRPAERAPARRERPVADLDSPVEIVSKPQPVYTEEARRQRIEGEVVLEVVFVATGSLKVLRVLGSLGHGLDEAAVEAARKIRFTPAKRDGRAVDHSATLRVVFRLA